MVTTMPDPTTAPLATIHPAARLRGEPRLVHTVRGVGYVLRQGGAE